MNAWSHQDSNYLILLTFEYFHSLMAEMSMLHDKRRKKVVPQLEQHHLHYANETFISMKQTSPLVLL